jgi:hypothetical protein
MSDADSKPHEIRPRRRGAWILSVVFIVAVAGIAAAWWTHGGPDVVGLWKGIDSHGHEHYFRFSKDGSLYYWDRERERDGSFTETDHRHGSYSTVDSRTIAVFSDGLAPQQNGPKMRAYADIQVQAAPLGRLTLVTPDQLQQDDSGADYLRRQVDYRRVAAK